MIHAQDVAYDPVIPSRGAGGGDNTNWASQSHLLFLRRHRASPPLHVSQFGTYPIVDPIDCLFRAISPEGDVSPSGVPCLFCVLSPTVRSGGRALIKTRSVGRGGSSRLSPLHPGTGEGAWWTGRPTDPLRIAPPLTLVRPAPHPHTWNPAVSPRGFRWEPRAVRLCKFVPTTTFLAYRGERHTRRCVLRLVSGGHSSARRPPHRECRGARGLPSEFRGISRRQGSL